MTRTRQRGHTLFEILLALGLSLVLLVAVYSALDMHWRYSSAGREQMERLQLTRALFERLRFDIRNIVDATLHQPVAAATGAATGSPPAGPGPGAGTQPSGADFPPLPALVGSANRMVLYVSRPRGERSTAGDMAGATTRSPGPESCYVTWVLVDDSPAAETGAGNRLPRLSAARGTEGAGGLARWETDRPLAMASEGGLPRHPDRGAGSVLAGEVTSIRFRYGDGQAWHDTWDSGAMQRLPRAVEVTIGLKPLVSRAVDAEGGQLQDRYRVVIAVPLAEPLPPG